MRLLTTLQIVHEFNDEGQVFFWQLGQFNSDSANHRLSF